MSLLKHGNVKIAENQSDPAQASDGLMTLAREKDPSKLPVYFCAMPFLLENEALRDIIANAATLQPQPVSVFISERSHKHQPDLMLSIQAYCVNNNDNIKLDSIDIISREQAFEPTEITLIFGTGELLQKCLERLPSSTDSTVIYFPENIQDQLELHGLLDLESKHSVIPVINTNSLCFNENQADGTAFIQAIDLAIAQDAQLFHWIEGNASQLALQQPAAVAQLIMRFNTSASQNSTTLLEDANAAIDLLSERTNVQISKADAMAILILMKTHISVLAGLLPSGADARVWFLLSTLGHTLYFNELTEHASALSTHLFEQSSSTLITDIGELSSHHEIESSAVEAAMLWLEDQFR